MANDITILAWSVWAHLAAMSLLFAVRACYLPSFVRLLWSGWTISSSMPLDVAKPAWKIWASFAAMSQLSAKSAWTNSRTADMSRCIGRNRDLGCCGGLCADGKGSTVKFLWHLNPQFEFRPWLYSSPHFRLWSRRARSFPALRFDCYLGLVNCSHDAFVAASASERSTKVSDVARSLLLFVPDLSQSSSVIFCIIFSQKLKLIQSKINRWENAKMLRPEGSRMGYSWVARWKPRMVGGYDYRSCLSPKIVMTNERSPWRVPGRRRCWGAL